MADIPEWKSTMHDLLAGTIGGCAGIFVGHPLDTVKLRIQTYVPPPAVPGVPPPPAVPGFSRILMNMIRTEGPLSLFNGLAPPLVGNAPMNALAFASYGNAQRLLKPYLPDTPVPADTLRPPAASVDALLAQLRAVSPGLTREQLSWRSTYSSASQELSLSRVTLAGCWSGLVSAVVTTPVELLKCRLQAADNTARGLVDCAVQSVRAHGVARGLFSGFWATALRDWPAMGVYFGVYEWLKRLGRSSSYVPHVSADMPDSSSRVAIPLAVRWEHHYEYSTPLLLAAGGVAGMLSWVVTYPVDTVKSVQQTQSLAGADPRSLRMLPTARRIVRDKGARGLLGGLTVTCVRALPVNAATFFIYEQALRWFQADQGHKQL